MTGTSERRLVLGAYALFAGVPVELLGHAYRSLAELPTLGALEIPLEDALGENEGLPGTRGGLPAVLADSWDAVITCVPTVMRRLGSDPTYGLASLDRDGRMAAVADVRRALAVAREAAQLSGRRRVRAVEVQSAPRRAGSSPAALRHSLEELLEVEAAGAVMAVEHCDAGRSGRRPEKGFLEIDEESAVLTAIDDDRLGLCVNWGRSAIEGRSARTPPDHVRLAARTGRLAGLMFSGASAVAGTWGAPWADGHIAPRGAGPTPHAWADSLLGVAEIAETVAAAGVEQPGFLGLKVTCGPAGTSVADRIVIARRSLEMITVAAGAHRRADPGTPAG